MARTTLGQRIRRLRTALGLTQPALARHVASGHAPTISRWENDTVAPTRSTLVQLANLTRNHQQTYLWLVDGGPEPTLAPQHSGGKQEAMLGAILAAPPPLPALPMLEQDPRETRQAFTKFIERVTILAAEGKVIRAHYLIDWATMLLRSTELNAYLAKRVHAILKELPILVLELDADDKVVGYSGNFGDGPDLDRLLIGRPYYAILPQLPQDQFHEAVQAARDGDTRTDLIAIPFKDNARAYVAHVYLFDEEHTMMFIQRPDDPRKDELGLKKRLGL